MLTVAAAWCIRAQTEQVTEMLRQKHEFAAALILAKALNKQTPDDVAIYGYGRRGNGAGQRDQAVENTQWMLRLRPGNARDCCALAVPRVAWRCERAEALQMAYDATPFANREGSGLDSGADLAGGLWQQAM